MSIFCMNFKQDSYQKNFQGSSKTVNPGKSIVKYKRKYNQSYVPDQQKKFQ